MLFLTLAVFSANIYAVTWYPLVAGNWDDPAIWTLDPSGSLPNNPGNYTPTTSPTSATDNVIILAGRIITIQAGNNNKTNAILTVNGELDITTTTGHTFSEIRGGGIIYLAADNFPSGDASHFITEDFGEGTVVYNGNGFIAGSARTFYNLQVNLNNATDAVIITNNYIINGNLTINKGKFQINNGSSTTALNILINGNTTVETDGSIVVGAGNAVHTIEFKGDVTNNGTIDFANGAIYTAATNGAVKAIFSGATDNILTCNGTTDFYRFFLDKGTDDTYILSVISTNTANFNLFGPVTGAGGADPEDGPGGWERLALVLYNGTLKLGSNINIPILGAFRTGTDPQEFHIPYNARLWIDGADVSTHTTGGGWRGITIYGTLQVSSGTFTNPANTGGITYFSNVAEPGKLVLEGGEIYTTQVKEANTTGRFSYIQSGGALYINNLSDSRGSSAVFALPQSDYSFNMSGGLIQIDAVNTTATNGIDIGCDEGNINVTGGTIELLIPTEDAGGQPEFEINTTAPFWNLTLTESVNAGTQQVALQSNLTVLNDLTIGANTTLETKGFDVKIGGDLIIEDGGVYDHNNNTTYFIGADNSSIIIENTATPSDLVFYNLYIEKDKLGTSSFYSVELQSPGRSETPGVAANTAITILNDLTIRRGSLNTYRYTIEQNGDIEIIDGEILADGTNPGRIELTGGTGQHTLKGSTSKEQSFGHIELNDGNGVILLSNVNCTDVTLTNGMFDLDIYNLTVTNNISGYTNARYFRSAGNASDGGLTLEFTLSGTYGANTSVAFYPVGVTGKYTPGEIFIDNYTFGSAVSGSVQVNPVNAYHPATRNPVNVLAYYWMSEETGFSSVPAANVYYRFTYSSNVPNNFREHVLFNNSWLDANSGINGSPILEYKENTFGFIDGEFAAGQNGEFNNRRILYSRKNGNWNDVTVGNPMWEDEVGTLIENAGNLPAGSDIVVVRNGNRVNVPSGVNPTVAELEFDHDTAVSHGIEDLPRVQVDVNNTATFIKVTGTGIFTEWINNVNDPVIIGDFGDFANQKYSWFLYVASADSVTLPSTPAVYPNVMTEGWNNSLTFPVDITINYNLNPRGRSTLLLNNGVAGDIYVGGNVWIGDWEWGKIEFPSTGNNRILTIGGNLDFTQSVTAPTNDRTIYVNNSTPSSLEHQLIIGGDIIQGVGIIDLYNGAGTANNTILTIDGESNSEFTKTAAEITDLYRLEIDKLEGYSFTCNNDFTLSGPTNGATKALELISGDLIILGSSTDITLTSGGANFKIPSGTSLSVSNAIVRATGTNSGIYLDGLMEVGDNSQWLLNGGTNNFIEYSASGNAEIQVEQGTLIVGSQIRRNTLTTEGILNFSQNNANSTVIIGETDAPENRRGVFEILNAGSEFTQVADASITIVHSQTTPAFPSLYLDPESSSLGSGSGFVFGNSSTLAANKDMGIYSTIDLKNITLDNSGSNSPSLTMWTVPLTITENLNIGSGTTFDANGLNLYVNGNFINSGNFTANNNTTYLNGTSDQRIVGNTNFYNLIKSSNNTLSLAAAGADITVQNDLQLLGGTLRDSSNTVYISGDCFSDATHIYGGAGDGIDFNGSFEQQLSGSGTFGKITISNNVTVPLGNDLTITDNLKMNGGVFTIGKNLLTLNLGAVIEETVAFSSSNMIQTNISFTDKGVKKVLPSGASSFVYPIGSGGKYTPVTMIIDANGNSSGSITVKAADEMHPSIQEDAEAPNPEIVDADNVLQYHWSMDANGISGFDGTVNMKYNPADVRVTSPYDIYDYITARLLNDGSGEWNKYDDTTKFDESSETLIFEFEGVPDEEISGDYTAGVDGSWFNGAIPDNVPEYETNTTGNWNTGTIWTPNVTGGPRGAIAKINLTHEVTATANYISSYTTEIQGTLKLNSTFGHRLGLVKGQGLMYLEREAIPAGVYDAFFSAAGGTIEFGGTTNFNILSSYPQVNNLKLSGTGDRKLSDANLNVLGNLTIDGTSGLKFINLYNRKIDIKGNLTLGTGAFSAGTGSNAIVELSGISLQTITGNFTGTNAAFNILKVNNVSGINLSGNVDINNQLTLTNGRINPGGNTLRIGLTGIISPASGSSSSYVNGKLTKVLTASGTTNFIYPIGKNGNPGKIEARSVTAFSGSGDVSAEYFFDNPTNAGYTTTSIGAGIGTVSQTEYWHFQAPTNAQSKLRFTLDGSSDVANAATDINTLRIVAWNGSQWVQVGGTPTITGTATSGTVTATADINCNSYQYFTLGTTETITLATGSIITGDATICEGESVNILVSLTGTANWTVYYSDGTSDYSDATSTSPLTITVSPVTTTTYTLDSITDNNGTGILVGDQDIIITVNPKPAAGLVNSSTGNEICEGEEVIFTGSGGSNYNFQLNNSSVQNSTLVTYTTSSLVDNDEVFVVVTTSSGCIDTSAITTITVNTVPAPAIISTDTIVCENALGSYSTAITGNSFVWSVTGGVIDSGQNTNAISVTWDTVTPVGTISNTGIVIVTETTPAPASCATVTPDFEVTVFRRPETGPAFHISNDNDL